MKQSILLILGSLELMLHGSPEILKNNDFLTISSRTTAIHYRYYIINRLEPALKIVQKTSSHFKKKPLNLPQLEHPLIRDCQEAIFEHHSATPFIALWQKILNYHLLEDNLFIQEFTSLTAGLIHHLLIENFRLTSPYNSLTKAYHQAQKLSLEKQIDFIHLCIDFFYDYAKKKSLAFQPFREFLNPTPSRKIKSSSDEIFERFYSLKRLDKPTKILLDLAPGIYIHPDFKKSIRALNQFQSVEDENYFKSILLLFLDAYKNILTKKLSSTSEQQARESLETLEMLYQKAPEITTEHMLNAIDLFTQELEGLSREKNDCSRYHLFKNSKTLLIASGAALASTGIYLLSHYLLQR